MVDRQRPDLQVVTPLPPLPSGVGQHNRELLDAVDGVWRVDVLGEHGSGRGGWETIAVLPATDTQLRHPGLPTVFHLGNSGYHRFAFEHALRTEAVIVLHDVVLHNGRFGELLRKRGGAGYKRLLQERYGASGRELAERMLAGRGPDHLRDFPLFEDYVERARLTIVHSEYARRWVLERAPDATVVRVPHGIALPALVDQDQAREALRLPVDAFIIASVTHVNPYKRLPVVVRALRRLIDRVPEAVLVVAGSVAPGVDLAGQVATYGLERHVRVLGYVTDDVARLVVRAADVCANLRYPSNGETSGSLLRMLGAGRPVIVTDDEPMREFPRDAVLPVPVDRFEDEMVAELLYLLADQQNLREAAGNAARAFVEREHTLGVEIAGYRQAIETAYGVSLPPVEDGMVHEPAPRFALQEADRTTPYSPLDGFIADALHDLRLDGHDDTISAVARAVVELKLDQLPAREAGVEAHEQSASHPSRVAGDPALSGLQVDRPPGG